MARFRQGSVKRDRIKWLIVFVVGVLLAAGLIGIFVRLDKNETTKNLSASAYSIGLLDDDTGKRPTDSADLNKSGISTDSYYLLDGLEITVKEKANVKYQVNYYDADKNFLGVENYTEDFVKESIPATYATAKYVRVEIVNMDDNDDTVGILEKASVAGLLTVTVKK